MKDFRYVLKEFLKIKNIILLIIMVFLDVFIKIIVDNCFMEKKVFINSKLGFTPFLNTEQLSIFNNELNLDLNLNILIMMNLIGIVVIIFLRKLLKKDKGWNIWLDIGTLMVFAGVVCSLSDKIFWKGSLDYILVFSKILDMKDIYLFVGLFICIIDACKQSIKKNCKTV